jgi:hypothetical protein
LRRLQDNPSNPSGRRYIEDVVRFQAVAVGANQEEQRVGSVEGRLKTAGLGQVRQLVPYACRQVRRASRYRRQLLAC